MSDHSDLKHFLDSLTKMLDTIAAIVYTAKQKIRVEQEIDENVASGTSEEFSGSSKTNAPPDVSRQGGPQPHVQGTTREVRRSTQETEKVVMKGGRMEVPHGRP